MKWFVPLNIFTQAISPHSGNMIHRKTVFCMWYLCQKMRRMVRIWNCWIWIWALRLWSQTSNILWACTTRCPQQLYYVTGHGGTDRSPRVGGDGGIDWYCRSRASHHICDSHTSAFLNALFSTLAPWSKWPFEIHGPQREIHGRSSVVLDEKKNSSLVNKWVFRSIRILKKHWRLFFVCIASQISFYLYLSTLNYIFAVLHVVGTYSGGFVWLVEF